MGTPKPQPAEEPGPSLSLRCLSGSSDTPSWPGILNITVIIVTIIVGSLAEQLAVEESATLGEGVGVSLPFHESPLC